LKAEYLHHSGAEESPIESWVPAHYSCCYGSVWKRLHTTVAVGVPLKAGHLVLICFGVYCEWIIRFSPKMMEFTRKTRRGTHEKGAPEVSAPLASPFKHTTGQTFLFSQNRKSQTHWLHK